MRAAQDDPMVNIVAVNDPFIGTEYMEYMFKSFAGEEKNNFKVHEITKKMFYETEGYYLEAEKLEHGIPCLGFNFVEKDRRKIDLGFVRKKGLQDGPMLGQLQRGEDIECVRYRRSRG